MYSWARGAVTFTCISHTLILWILAFTLHEQVSGWSSTIECRSWDLVPWGLGINFPPLWSPTEESFLVNVRTVPTHPSLPQEVPPVLSMSNCGKTSWQGFPAVICTWLPRQLHGSPALSEDSSELHSVLYMHAYYDTVSCMHVHPHSAGIPLACIS